jgi:hypothetical protein
MSTDFELFPGKDLSGLFQDIYNNQINKKKHISDIIHEMRNSIRHAGDMAVIGPIVKDLIDTSVRNDEQLIKLATIAQRIIASNSKSEGEDGFLTKEEREQLLQELQEVEDAVADSDKVEEIKTKVE